MPSDVHLVHPEVGGRFFRRRGRTLVTLSEFAHLQAGFCIKTRNEKTGNKVFVNVCSADAVEKPTSEGQRWQLPMMAGKPRYEKDNKGQLALTLDIVFHPNALHLASSNPGFKRMVAGSAVERAQELMARFGVGEAADTVLDKNYTILKHKRCMGDKPAIIRAPNKATPGVAAPAPAPPAPAPAAAAVPPPATPAPAPAQPSGEAEPELTIVERGSFDLASSVSFPAGVPGPARRPAELVLRFALPACKNAKGVQLDVAERKVSLVKEGVYRLQDRALPFPVKPELAAAKFDKSRRLLQVTVPVLPPPAPQPDTAPQEAQPVKPPVSSQPPKAEDSGTPEAVELLADSKVKPTTSTGSGEVRHDRWVDTRAQPGSSLPADVAEAVRAAATAQPAAPDVAPWTWRQGSDTSTVLLQVPHVDADSVKVSLVGDAEGPQFLHACMTAHVEPSTLEEHVAAAGGVNNLVLKHVPRSQGAGSRYALLLKLPSAVAGARHDVSDLNIAVVLTKAKAGEVWGDVLQEGGGWAPPRGLPAVPSTSAAVVAEDGGSGIGRDHPVPAPSTPPEPVLELGKDGTFDVAQALPSTPASLPASTGTPQERGSSASSSGKRRRRRGAAAAAEELD